MKDHARLVISIIFLSPLIALGATSFRGVVSAQTEPTDQQAQTELPVATKEVRIAERKAKYKDRYTKAQLVRTQARCTAAQQKLGGIKTRMAALEKARTEQYVRLIEKLETAGQKLKSSGVDTAPYDSYVNELKTKIASTQQAFSEYMIALGDASELKCTDDVEGFRASLEETRNTQQALRKQGADIRLYLNQKIKPALVAMKQTLQTNVGATKNE